MHLALEAAQEFHLRHTKSKEQEWVLKVSRRASPSPLLGYASPEGKVVRNHCRCTTSWVVWRKADEVLLDGRTGFSVISTKLSNQQACSRHPSLQPCSHQPASEAAAAQQRLIGKEKKAVKAPKIGVDTDAQQLRCRATEWWSLEVTSGDHQTQEVQ